MTAAWPCVPHYKHTAIQKKRTKKGHREFRNLSWIVTFMLAWKPIIALEYVYTGWFRHVTNVNGGRNLVVVTPLPPNLSTGYTRADVDIYRDIAIFHFCRLIISTHRGGFTLLPSIRYSNFAVPTYLYN